MRLRISQNADKNKLDRDLEKSGISAPVTVLTELLSTNEEPHQPPADKHYTFLVFFCDRVLTSLVIAFLNRCQLTLEGKTERYFTFSRQTMMINPELGGKSQ